MLTKLMTVVKDTWTILCVSACRLNHCVSNTKEKMFCCSITGFIAIALCVIFVPMILLLYLTGHIALLPEVTKLMAFGGWCYLDALFNWIAPRKRKSIEGLTAVVTGGGHGIGKEIALGLAKKGVKVVLWDINEKNMNKVEGEIKDVNGEAFSYVCDVTNKDEVYETASKVRLNVGDVDILVNNAGVVVGKNFLSCSDKEIEKTMNVNLMAHYWTLKAFLGGMVEKDSGHVVAISSIMSVMSAPGLVDYCTSKAGVSMMMDGLRQEIISQKKYGVGFTTILPTKVDTGLFEGAGARFGELPPTVEPKYVAKKTIDAIERNEKYVVLPPWLSVVLAMKSLLPQKLLDALVRFTRMDEAMKNFTGHKKEN